MISIIIPCYNVSDFIGQALDSLLSQPYIIDKDYEIICIDDYSTDTTLEILQQYHDKGVKIIPLKANQGVSHARNVGMERASGGYIWFFDADDLATPDSLHKIFQTIDKNPNVEALRFYASFIGEESNNNEIILLNEKPTNNNLYCFVLQSKFLKDKGLYFCEEMTYSEDIAFICMCFVNNINMLCIDKTLYYYRQRASSLMHRRDEKKYFQSIFKLPFYYNSFKSHIGELDNVVMHSLNSLVYDSVQSCLMHAVRKDQETLNNTLRSLKSAGLYPYPIRWKLLTTSNKLSVAFSRSLFLLAPISGYLLFLNRFIGTK